MKIIELFKNVFAGIMQLTPSFIFAQDKLIINEELPVYAEKLDLIFENRNCLVYQYMFWAKANQKLKLVIMECKN